MLTFLFHYENVPDFISAVKNKTFIGKFLIVLTISAHSKHWLWVHVKTGTHNLCFGAKTRKIGIPLLTPVLLYKSRISRTCFHDAKSFLILNHVITIADDGIKMCIFPQVRDYGVGLSFPCVISEQHHRFDNIFFISTFITPAFYECANRYIKCADSFLRMRKKRLSNARLNCAEIIAFTGILRYTDGISLSRPRL